MRKSSLMFCLFFLGLFLSTLHSLAGRKRIIYKQKRPYLCTKGIYKAANWIGELAVDALMLNVKLFSADSAKIITCFTPFYLACRFIDENVQNNFYDQYTHKNKNQMPWWCHQIAQKGIGVPMVALSSLMIFSHDEDLRTTARMFAIGIPFVHSGKDLIKKADGKICLRPWHEGFSKKKRSTGGFPSGHMANATYMATLFGIRHGWKFWLPLGAFASYIFVDFLNCNRHYLSQLVAGSCLGVLYALAASKVVDKKLYDRFELSMGTTDRGDPALKIAYCF